MTEAVRVFAAGLQPNQAFTVVASQNGPDLNLSATFGDQIVTDGASTTATYTLTGDREAWVCIILHVNGVDTSTPEDVTQTYLQEDATTAPTATGLPPANNASGDNIWAFSGCDVATNTMGGPGAFAVAETQAASGIDTWLGSKDNLWKSVEGDAETLAVEAVDAVEVSRHVASLVALELAHEVPAECGEF